jgi:hypothetical protein
MVEQSLYRVGVPVLNGYCKRWTPPVVLGVGVCPRCEQSAPQESSVSESATKAELVVANEALVRQSALRR